jgi:hypothetical protein
VRRFSFEKRFEKTRYDRNLYLDIDAKALKTGTAMATRSIAESLMTAIFLYFI